MIKKGKKIVVGLSGGVDSSVALMLLKKQGWQPVAVSLKLPVWQHSRSPQASDYVAQKPSVSGGRPSASLLSDTGEHPVPPTPLSCTGNFQFPIQQDKRNVLRENICCTKESCKRAKNICQKLGVPYFIFDARKDFQKEVVNYFVSEFRKARTPNPCVVCNRELKFRKLFEFAKKQGIKYVATGHYARLRAYSAEADASAAKAGQGYGGQARPGREILKPKSQMPKYQLLMAEDKNKDQSYFLSFLPQKWLGCIVFPLGNWTKKEVYQIAKKEGFDFFEEKGQSQGFCYVGGKSLDCFLGEKLGKKPGKIVDSKGRVLSGHHGLHFYTIGQRKGLKLTHGPYFVKTLESKKNLLIVNKSQKEVSQKEVMLRPFHFISGQSSKRKLLVTAKTRYRQPAVKATLYPAKNGKLKIIFEKPQFAVTPGQFCVFYQNNVCLGGGVIN